MPRLVEDTGQYQGVTPEALTGDAFLETIDPKYRTMIKKFASGELPISSRLSSSSKGLALIQAVSQYDPSFDVTDFNKRNKTAQGFATGKQGDAVRAANQALAHMGSLDKAISNLDNFNGILTPVNYLVNPVEEAFGDKRQEVFRTKARAVSSELRKVFAGSGGGSLQELKDWESSFPVNASQEQQKSYLKAGMELLKGGIDALQGQYQSGMGQNRDVKTLLNPQAQEVYKKISGEDIVPMNQSQSTQQAQPSGTQEGVKSVSKSGKPIIFRNGNWEYQ
jgi:hypothetical protein